MPEQKHHQLDWINNLRVISMYAVIVLHVTSLLLMQYGKVPANQWLVADFYNALSRFGVPVFVMMTGALLLHRDYELGDFLKRRLGRIIVPFLFWSLVYVGYSWYNEDIAFTGDAWANIKIVLHQLKYGSSYHLWYVYMLIGLYFFIPILSKFVRNASENEVLYFLLVWFGVMLIAQPYLSRFNPNIDLHNFAGYAGYLVLGHYLAFKKIDLKYHALWFSLLIIVCLAIIVAGTYWVSNSQKALSTMFYEPISPVIVLLASGVFLLCRSNMPKAHAWVKRARDFAGSYIFGIYLSHALILYLIADNFNIDYTMCTPWVSIPVTALISFLLSLLLVYIISKIPFGKYVSG